MKRTRLLIPAVFIFLVLVVAIALRPEHDSHAPRFVPGAPASLNPSKWDEYNWLTDSPFEGGRVWLWTSDGTNDHSYLYDLDRRVILGELFNARLPELRSRDGSRLLVVGDAFRATSLRRKAIDVIDAVRRVFGTKAPAANSTRTFWVLDIRDNSATRLGALPIWPGTGIGWHPSPNFRYGYATSSTTQGSGFFLCDLETISLTRVPVDGELKGWWDDQHILIENAANDFVLFDIVTQKIRTLFSPADIESFLRNSGLTNGATGLTAFANWNGRDYDVYLGIRDRVHGPGNVDSFLLRADRTGPALQLLYRNFEFRRGGKLDSKATRYLFVGESGVPGGGSDLYLRDLTNGAILTVIPLGNKGHDAIPNFYGNEVIYFRDRILRRIDLNGSNDAPLLPAAGK